MNDPFEMLESMAAGIEAQDDGETKSNDIATFILPPVVLMLFTLSWSPLPMPPRALQAKEMMATIPCAHAACRWGKAQLWHAIHILSVACRIFLG